MEGTNEQPVSATEVASINEQENNEEGMEESEEYGFDGEEYRHFVPRGRGGFRYLIIFSDRNYFNEIIVTIGLQKL